MKKYLIIIILLLINFVAGAQEDPGRKMKSDMGKALFMGINNASISGDENYNDPVIAMHLGGAINLANFAENWRGRSELLFSQQGGKSSYGSDTYGGKSELKLNYLQLALLLRYQWNNGFYAEAGLQPGVLLSAKKKSSFTGPGGGQDPNTSDVKESLKKFDVGIPLGIGYIIKKKLGISARMAPGLMNINKTETAEAKPKNFVLSARLSYYF